MCVCIYTHIHTCIYICDVCMYTHTMEYYLAVKSDILPFATWMDLGFYAKWNKSDRKRQILYDLTHVESKKENSEQT